MIDFRSQVPNPDPILWRTVPFTLVPTTCLTWLLPLIVLVQLECFEIFCVIKNIVLWNWSTFTIFRTCSNLHWHKFIFKCSSCPRQPHPSCLVVTVSRKHIQVQSPYKTFFTKPLSKVHTMHGYTDHDRQWAIPPFRQSPLHQPRKMQKKHDLSMQSGTLGVRQTKKSPTFVHVTPRALCHTSGNLIF